MCSDSPQSLCERLRSYKGSALFVGLVQKVESRTVTLHGNKLRQQVVTLAVEEAFAGVEGNAVTVTSFYDAGMCGYRFRKGSRYLVDAGYVADSTYLGLGGTSGFRSGLDVGSCGMTRSAEYAADSIKFLRTLKQSPHGGVVFGTVKRYVDRATFVSLNNKPLSGTSVLLEATPDERLHTEKREAAVDSSGYYQFVGLPAGIYTHTVQVPSGLKGEMQHTVEVQTDGCAQVDVRVRGVH
jgi:hypothetical protein